MTIPSSDSPSKQPAPIVAASYLCYAWGIVLLVPTAVILIPLSSKPRAFMAAFGFLSIVVIIGVAYCLGGYLARRRRRSGALYIGILIVLTSALQFSMHLNFAGINMKPPWLIVNALLLVCLLANWARVGERDRAIGA